jgi:hypothetical protein
MQLVLLPSYLYYNQLKKLLLLLQLVVVLLYPGAEQLHLHLNQEELLQLLFQLQDHTKSESIIHLQLLLD